MSDLSQPGLVPGSGATPEAYRETRRASRVVKTGWESFFTELTGKLEQEERYFDWMKYREGVRNQRFYEGSFRWFFSDQTGLVTDLPHSDEDPIFPHNWFQYFTDLSIAAALEASPDIVIDPSSEDDSNVYAARSGQRLADYAERELLTEEFRLESEKTRQLYSGIWWYNYWSMDAGRLYASRPTFEEKTSKSTSDAFLCGSPNCENMGPVARLIRTATGPTCPKCRRSDMLQILHGPQTTVHEITGYQKIPIGFPVVEAVTPLQMKGDRRAGHYLRGGYLCRTRLIDRDIVAEHIPWWDNERGVGRGAGATDYGIRAEEMARKPSTADGNMSRLPIESTDRESRDVVVKQWWLQAYKYANVEFEADTEFIGDESTVVPARTRLGEVFPDGLYLLNVGGKWLDHSQEPGEDFRKKWVYIPYVYLPNKTDGGTTISSMAEPQREMIEINSLNFLYLKARSGGAPTIIKSPLSETDFDGSPATITRLPHGAPDLKSLFFQPEFPPADQNLAAYTNRMSGEMQIMAQVVSPTTTGDPSAQEMGGTDTARGMMIMNAKAQGLQGPKLMPLAYGQAMAVRQWIDLFREHVTDDVPIPLQGKTGEPEWFEINGSDLEGDFVIYPKPKSWLPHPREEQQAAIQNAFTTFGQILLNPDPSLATLKDKILEVYGIEGVDLGDYDQDTRDAMLRIDAMEASADEAVRLAEMYMKQAALQPQQPTASGPTPPLPDPVVIAATILSKMVPVDEDLDDPNIYMTYFKRWLRGDEGKDARAEVKAAVRLQWKAYQVLAQKAQEAQMQAQAQQAAMIEQAKAAATSQVEQVKSQGRVTEIGAKGQVEMAKLQATPPTPQAPEAPAPPDNTVRDNLISAAVASAQEDQKHSHRMDELGLTHGHRLREALAKGAMGALSHAGVGGSLVEGAPEIPGLPGLQGTQALPAQAAV